MYKRKDLHVAICTLFHFAGSDTLISGIPQIAVVEIDPRTPQGTKIYSYNMFLNITKGSPLMEFYGNHTISWLLYYFTTYHGKDIWSDEFWDYAYHYYMPQFGVKVPGMEVSAFIYLTGPIEELFPVSNTEIEQCSWGNSTFIKVPVEIYLLSPYLYHLGTSLIDHDIYVQGYKHSYLHHWIDVKTNAGEIFMLFYCAWNTALNCSDELFMKGN